MINTFQEYFEGLKTLSVESKKTLSDYLDEAGRKFLSLFNELAPSLFVHIRLGKMYTGGEEKKNEFARRLFFLVGEINETGKLYETGNYVDSIPKMHRIIFNESNQLRPGFTPYLISRNSYWYRMRSAEKYEVYKKEGLYLISDDKLELVATQRFNGEGWPVLYLASSLYCAWEEVRRADISQVNFAAFKAQRIIPVLDIAPPSQIIAIGSFIRAYFSIICSCEVTEDKIAHKWQYVVSNLLMNTVRYHIDHAGKQPSVFGIHYLSSKWSHADEYQLEPSGIMDAVVLPASERLHASFLMTDPRTLFFYHARHIGYWNPDIAYTSEYKSTIFFALEEQLKREKFFSVEIND